MRLQCESMYYLLKLTLQATAATKAAPLPLPSSESIKSNCKKSNKKYVKLNTVNG